jgi:hypothetical protein
MHGAMKTTGLKRVKRTLMLDAGGLCARLI